MDWGDIMRIVDVERERGNGVAEIILQMKLQEGRIVVGLREETGEDEDEGDETDDEEGGGREGRERLLVLRLIWDCRLGLMRENTLTRRKLLQKRSPSSLLPNCGEW